MPRVVSNPAVEKAKEREEARPRIKHSPPVQRPVNESDAVNDHGTRYSIAQRIQALTFVSCGISYRQIYEWIGVPPKQTQRLMKKAIQRGYRPEESKRILESFVEDGIRSGRPREVSKDDENAILTSIVSSGKAREKSTEVLGYENGWSASTCLRVLRNADFNSVKPTTKPGLNAAQRKVRLEWCQSHADWTLEDWKRVIWSDETSVVLGQRRGSVRIWRRSYEAVEKSAIRSRWKGFSKFMFWGCFSYNQKGPCHIWRPETAVEKREAEKEIQEWNNEISSIRELEWQLSKSRLRPTKGPKPQWRFTEKTGKLVRRGNGGIDWYRYQKVLSQLAIIREFLLIDKLQEIVQAKMIPFARECQTTRSDTVV